MVRPSSTDMPAISVSIWAWKISCSWGTERPERMRLYSDAAVGGVEIGGHGREVTVVGRGGAHGFEVMRGDCVGR